MPHSIKIGPYKVPVRYVKDLHVEGQPAFGSYTDDPHGIELDQSLRENPQQLSATVIHESLECINVIHAVKLNHDQIEQLTTALTSLLKDNRWIAVTLWGLRYAGIVGRWCRCTAPRTQPSRT